jgi:hypothetical protein
MQQIKSNPYLIQGVPMYHPNTAAFIINNGVPINKIPYQTSNHQP